MDLFMKLYFEEMFELLDRDILNTRYKRRELVQYFNAAIVGCAKGENTTGEASCRVLICAILRHHNECKTNNGGVCLMGKYHNILYIAMKLAFDWNLQDNGTIAALLDEMYACERTFERIFLGAIFGTAAPHFLAGWKSDFLNKQENLHALFYFLDHATNANLEYTEGDEIYRFVDVPLESCGNASPLRVVIQMGSAEMLLILLRFGARVSIDEASSNAIETVLDRLLEHRRRYPYELVACLQIILRSIPHLILTIDKKDVVYPNYNYQRKCILEKYEDLLVDHIIPSTRCGLQPVELKHLSRCAIRKRLWMNFQLPFGIQRLPLPETLRKYLDLLSD